MNSVVSMRNVESLPCKREPHDHSSREAIMNEPRGSCLVANEGLRATKQMGNPALDNINKHIVSRLPTSAHHCHSNYEDTLQIMVLEVLLTRFCWPSITRTADSTNYLLLLLIPNSRLHTCTINPTCTYNSNYARKTIQPQKFNYCTFQTDAYFLWHPQREWT